MSDISLFQDHKENIQPVAGGRSLKKLAASLRLGSRSNLDEDTRRDRDHFEAQLAGLDEMDDPLSVFVDYVASLRSTFAYNSKHPELVEVLETATRHFMEDKSYANDIRYVRLWLEWCRLSDVPRDTLAFMAHHGVGERLALFYEEFARHLEVAGAFADAHAIYQRGIAFEARPLARLERNYRQFRQRTEGVEPTERPAALGLKRGHTESETADIGVMAGSVSASPCSKRSKIAVFADHVQRGTIVDSIARAASFDPFASNLNTRLKENVARPTQWTGATIKQHTPLELGGRHKISVYVDEDPERQPAATDVVPPVGPRCVDERVADGMVTVSQVSGKHDERLQFNSRLLQKSFATELCSLELLLATVSTHAHPKAGLQPSSSREAASTIRKPLEETPVDPEPVQLSQATIPDNFSGDDSHPLALRPPSVGRVPGSPTTTFFGKDTKKELLGMYDVGVDLHDSEEEDLAIAGAYQPTLTNFTDYVTELPLTGQQASPRLPHENDHDNDSAYGDYAYGENVYHENVYHENDGVNDDNPNLTSEVTPVTEHSSSFVMNPEVPLAEVAIVDVSDLSSRSQQLLSMRPSTCEGFYDHSSKTINRSRNFVNLFLLGKPTPASSASLIDFCGDSLYSIKSELGRGGYGVVYLIESCLDGTYGALKIEKPASKWEYYILSQIQARVPVVSRPFFVEPYKLHLFADESYLFMSYCPQFSMLDLVNHYREQSQAVEEALAIHFAIELLKATSDLHEAGVIHGDLKPDNCMVRISLQQASITLIDFGRAVDVKNYGESVEFVSKYKPTKQDCPAMNEGKPWSYDADYFGVAAILHTLLFGEFIKVTNRAGLWELEKPLKRWWQSELWTPLFRLLLNPYSSGQPKTPLRSEIDFQVRKLEAWYSQNSKHLPSVLTSLEHDLNLKRRNHENR
ncbi:hypothetical protein DICA1_F19548 [Diutina catenulata]